MLASLGGGQLTRVHGDAADGRTEARQRAVHGSEERSGGVLEQVPSVGHLPGVRAGA